MDVSAAILLGCGIGGLIVAWYTAIARVYRSEVLAARCDSARVAIAALVGFVFIAPAMLAGCCLLVAKARPSSRYRRVESEMNALRRT